MNPQLIFLGAPGSGKGTQAKSLVTKSGFVHLSTGDLLRKEVAKESELGNRITKIIDAGKLVDDSIVLELIKINCDLSKDSYIFDGYPRNINQAKSLNEVILHDKKYIVLYFDINFDLLLKRLINRRTCRDCSYIYNLLGNSPKKEGVCDNCGGEVFQRHDDNEEVVNKRINVYKSTIKPILDYYQQKDVLKKIDASLDLETVAQKIDEIIK